MGQDTPIKVSPTLLKHIAWVQDQLKMHRQACEERFWHECQLRDVSPRDSTLDPVHLGCEVCQVQMVIFKVGYSDY